MLSHQCPLRAAGRIGPPLAEGYHGPKTRPVRRLTALDRELRHAFVLCAIPGVGYWGDLHCRLAVPANPYQANINVREGFDRGQIANEKPPSDATRTARVFVGLLPCGGRHSGFPRVAVPTVFRLRIMSTDRAAPEAGKLRAYFKITIGTARTEPEHVPRIFHGSTCAIRASFRLELPIRNLGEVEKPL